MSAPTASEHLLRRLLQGGGALILWTLHFFGAYGLVAAACCTAFADATWFGQSALRVVLWAWGALAALAIAWLIACALRLPPGVLRSAGLIGGALALIGVAWTTLPTAVLALPLCRCAT